MTASAAPGPDLPANGAAARGTADDLASQDFTAVDERTLNVPLTLRDLAVVTVIAAPIQMLATDLSALDIVIGLVILYAICVVGILLTRYLPVRMPSVAWISLVAIVLTLPMLPWSAAVLPLVEGIDFLALAVPPLAYAGLAITRNEIAVMRTSGWKIFVIAILVFIGTYVGSAVIAELMLAVTGA